MLIGKSVNSLALFCWLRNPSERHILYNVVNKSLGISQKFPVYSLPLRAKYFVSPVAVCYKSPMLNFSCVINERIVIYFSSDEDFLNYVILVNVSVGVR